ncbi:btk-binding protein-related [Anaeramoeba flamelloides]|uniref:Btk-binding protein-related n=1 Tax=Anaeramoeba flamelloides TaxID=1746091 RepID=A0AAV7YEH1_9EUKA|nr:btk-binding protein-related [Anaeramoeba flamelloides]
MEEKPQIYLSGLTKFSSLTKNSLLPYWSSFDPLKEVNKIVSGQGNEVLAWHDTNKLTLFLCNYETNTKVDMEIENEQIKDIHSGYFNFLILTESGRVYSLANGKTQNSYNEIPFSDPYSSTWQKPRLVTFFTEKDMLIKELAMGSATNYFVTTQGQLYVNGYNSGGRVGDGTNENRQLPILIAENVTRVFCGCHGKRYFYTTENDELFACGNGAYGELGNGSETNVLSPVKISDWKSEDIQDMVACDCHSLLLTNEGKLYTTGDGTVNGLGQRKNKFTLLNTFDNKRVAQITGGSRHSILLTDENEMYGWGFYTSNQPTSEFTSWDVPRKIKLPDLPPTGRFRISCGFDVNYIYLIEHNTIRNDLQNLFENKQMTDSTVANDYSVHRALVESRVGCKLDQISKILLTKNQEEINIFLQWVYSGKIENIGVLQEIFKLLGLTFEFKANIEDDLFKLLNDEDSKDFKILVKENDEEDDEEEEEEDEKEEYFDEIPVHKFILIARSGLFREMFENIKEKNDTVKDYSGKSVESVEVLIKFLYTGKIELTADDDPEIIVEELQDAAEYYKLNEKTNLPNEIKKIKMKYNLN